MFTSYIYTYADIDAQIQYIVTLHYMKLHDITVHCIALHCNTSITDKQTDLQTYRHLGIHTYIHTTCMHVIVKQKVARHEPLHTPSLYIYVYMYIYRIYTHVLRRLMCPFTIMLGNV